MTELWQPVQGYEGLYEVSDQGRVRTVATGLIRKTPVGVRGYPTVDLKNKGHRKTFTVHTLVLTAFVGPRPHKMECRHLDGDRENSNLSNLRWGTSSENDDDRRLHGTFIEGEKHGAAKLTNEQARAIKHDNTGRLQREIAEQYGINSSLVSMIKSGKRWGFIQ